MNDMEIRLECMRMACDVVHDGGHWSQTRGIAESFYEFVTGRTVEKLKTLPEWYDEQHASAKQ